MLPIFRQWIYYNKLDKHLYGHGHNGQISQTFTVLQHLNHGDRTCRFFIVSPDIAAVPRGSMGNQCT